VKIRLKIRSRGKRGCDISSVPLRKLVRLGKSKKRFWELQDDWLILEGFG
jgi:hypothetical protein